jgi:hypothetical protein
VEDGGAHCAAFELFAFTITFSVPANCWANVVMKLTKENKNKAAFIDE